MKLTAAQRKQRTTKHVAIGAFLAGAAVSIAANLIAADPGWLAKAVAVWPALALLITVHLYQHVPVTRRDWVGFAHRAAVLCVIAIAGWVSYWHIHEVVLLAGETRVTAYLFPATIDAMMAIAAAVAGHKPKAVPARRAAAKRPSVAAKASSSSKAQGNLRAV